MRNHFNKIYWYIVMLTVIVLGYVIAITFLPIPKENQRFVDISLAFLLGFMSGAAAFLTGGNPTIQKKGGNAEGATTAEFTASVTTEPIDKPDPNNNG